MRIVAGTARGRRIETLPGTATRPTSDRVRESIFNSLFSQGVLQGAKVLDLFAGSGALGLEALSRGAAHATFVDSSRHACRIVEQNVAKLGFADRSRVVTADAVTWLERHPDPFDVIVCDPPYEFGEWDAILSAARAAIFVAESDRPIAADPAGGAGGWVALRSKRYGTARVSILRPATEAEPGITVGG